MCCNAHPQGVLPSQLILNGREIQSVILKQLTRLHVLLILCTRNVQLVISILWLKQVRKCYSYSCSPTKYMQKKNCVLCYALGGPVFYSRFTNRTDHETGSRCFSYSELKANIVKRNISRETVRDRMQLLNNSSQIRQSHAGPKDLVRYLCLLKSVVQAQLQKPLCFFLSGQAQTFANENIGLKFLFLWSNKLQIPCIASIGTFSFSDNCQYFCIVLRRDKGHFINTGLSTNFFQCLHSCFLSNRSQYRLNIARTLNKDQKKSVKFQPFQQSVCQILTVSVNQIPTLGVRLSN